MITLISKTRNKNWFTKYSQRIPQESETALWNHWGNCFLKCSKTSWDFFFFFLDEQQIVYLLLSWSSAIIFKFSSSWRLHYIYAYTFICFRFSIVLKVSVLFGPLNGFYIVDLAEKKKKKNYPCRKDFWFLRWLEKENTRFDLPLRLIPLEWCPLSVRLVLICFSPLFCLVRLNSCLTELKSEVLSLSFSLFLTNLSLVQ